MYQHWVSSKFVNLSKQHHKTGQLLDCNAQLFKYSWSAFLDPNSILMSKVTNVCTNRKWNRFYEFRFYDHYENRPTNLNLSKAQEVSKSFDLSFVVLTNGNFVVVQKKLHRIRRRKIKELLFPSMTKIKLQFYLSSYFQVSLLYFGSIKEQAFYSC